MKKQRTIYYCRHCGKKHNTQYMAEYCFILDMKHLQKDNNENRHKRLLYLPGRQGAV